MGRLSKAIVVQVQTRDICVLRGLFESRTMTIQHVAALYFDGRREAAKKRLQKLKGAKLIIERPRMASEPSTLMLTRTAFKVLHEHGVLADYPKLGLKSLDRRTTVSPLTIRHELQVMDVKAAIVSAIRETKRFTVAEFSTWPLLHQFKARRSVVEPTQSGEVFVKPDGFIRIHEQEPDGGLFEHTFFLEVDRSTERQAILAERALYYLDYYRRGGLAVRHGQPREAYREFPFRVLYVLPTVQRRNNTAARLLQNQPPTLTQAWLTTYSEVMTDPLGAIWLRPQDYRDATTNLMHNTVVGRQDERYKESAMDVGPQVTLRTFLDDSPL